ncbi:hypothetical protein H072_1253 [Dactylellina haptotyla CBS 200.50]|uniref:Uncharacterized protein n=1 Tax=Dactylellina haptotyla (strain CBS 200.50) TaxID=1284197 RepID=S8BZ49_DACHA|nr:hypothetical protein H072_1253 [Dactylellina haptotyla CBS 200.50]
MAAPSYDSIVDSSHANSYRYHGSPEPEGRTANQNPVLAISDVFRHFMAIAAGIDRNFADLDDYSERKISVVHLVYALLTYGLQPNALALELLKKVLKHKGLQLKRGYTWEEVVERLFEERGFGRELTKWARRYFAGLLVPLVAAKGTPSSNGTGTANRTQSALRELCLKRDGHMTVIGRVWNRFWPRDVVPPPRTELWGLRAPQSLSHHTIRLARDAFRRFEWSIEARLKKEDDEGNTGRWVYVFRKFCPYLPRSLDQHADGEEFGGNDGNVPSPNPQLLSVCTALAKVANVSGAVEAIDMILRDEEEMKERGLTGRTWGKVGQNYLLRQLERLSTEQ